MGATAAAAPAGFEQVRAQESTVLLLCRGVRCESTIHPSGTSALKVLKAPKPVYRAPYFAADRALKIKMTDLCANYFQACLLHMHCVTLICCSDMHTVMSLQPISASSHELRKQAMIRLCEPAHRVYSLFPNDVDRSLFLPKPCAATAA
eukprot:491001-Pelagomonas_calceolata.AAC.1